MHIRKFLESCIIRRKGEGGSYVDNDFLLDMHPTQLLYSTLSLPIYEIKYQYYTARLNMRTGKKYMLSAYVDDELWLQAESELRGTIDSNNLKTPYRAISNVKILEIVKVADAQLSFNN